MKMVKQRWKCKKYFTGQICRDVKQKSPTVAVGLTGIGEVQLSGYTCKRVGKGAICFPKK